ncbi:MAG: alpha/beta hydrolase [Rhodospirillaceae bacterium]|nr:alpha/beta hydrolase [Rhodospirillaceae bacterium]MBT3491947.1 alpha/beta hydrolase [Rhodospirillaceae bacterium]MBT3782043.1 alpha/beta hydrolase [Rhodospirillaceae bacterium]MBT3977475.1 alpha/beta hydrolase [Rhodospirillaceae bacterium]MBT4171391.1 alpha/beta hydrolase [Rhodospirillaceae bacterium]
MSEKIFGDYDQAGLDQQYDNRAKVAQSAEMLQQCAVDSESYRQQAGGRLDVSFGPGADETLDVFPAPAATMETDAGLAPIQVFIHGGYWKMLSKDDYSYVAKAFTPKGCATVVLNYGLIPGIDMDELVRQCRAALAWTYRNAASFGGDRERIYVSGHSAGGHLVAMAMATDWPAFDGEMPVLPADLLKGGCGISGLYDLEPIRLCFLNDDLKLTVVEAARNSPVHLAPGGTGPLILVLGGDEGPEYLRQSEALAAAWRDTGLALEVVVLTGQNHFSIVDQLNDPEAELSRLILRQMGC